MFLVVLDHKRKKRSNKIRERERKERRWEARFERVYILLDLLFFL